MKQKERFSVLYSKPWFEITWNIHKEQPISICSVNYVELSGLKFVWLFLKGS